MGKYSYSETKSLNFPFVVNHVRNNASWCGHAQCSCTWVIIWCVHVFLSGSLGSGMLNG